MRKSVTILVFGLAVLAIVIVLCSQSVDRKYTLRATSIPVLAIADLVEKVEYQLESFQTVDLIRDGVGNQAYQVLISDANFTSYNGMAILVVAKQLVEICPADSTQPAVAWVTTVVSEGGQTRILHLRPRHLRPDSESRALLAALPAGN
jgi:hypothetical protein